MIPGYQAYSTDLTVTDRSLSEDDEHHEDSVAAVSGRTVLTVLSSAVSRCPPEIWLIIFRYVVVPPRSPKRCEDFFPFETQQPESRWRMSETLRLALVCRAWKAMVEPMVFEQITLFDASEWILEDDGWEALGRSICGRPAASYVSCCQMLDMLAEETTSMRQTSWLPNIQRFDSLQEFEWHCVFSTASIRLLNLLGAIPTARLKRFIIQYSPIAQVELPFALFRDFLLSCAALKLLDVSGVASFDDTSDEGGALNHRMQSRDGAAHVSRLHTLSLQSHTGTRSLVHFLSRSSLPDLRTLSIYSVHDQSKLQNMPQWDYGVSALRQFLRVHGAQLTALAIYSYQQFMHHGETYELLFLCPGITDLVMDLRPPSFSDTEDDGEEIQVPGPQPPRCRSVRKLGLRFFHAARPVVVKAFTDALSDVFPRLEMVRIMTPGERVVKAECAVNMSMLFEACERKGIRLDDEEGRMLRLDE